MNEEVILNDRMCLCGMLAAEYATPPAPMQDELRRFFDANERWLAVLLEEGRRAGKLAFREPATERARLLLAGVMNLLWVAALTTVVIAEKALPRGEFGVPTRFHDGDGAAPGNEPASGKSALDLLKKAAEAGVAACGDVEAHVR